MASHSAYATFTRGVRSKLYLDGEHGPESLRHQRRHLHERPAEVQPPSDARCTCARMHAPADSQGTRSDRLRSPSDLEKRGIMRIRCRQSLIRLLLGRETSSRRKDSLITRFPVFHLHDCCSLMHRRKGHETQAALVAPF